MEPLRASGTAFVPEVPGGLDRSPVLANSGKGKLRTLERVVFLGNVYLAFGVHVNRGAPPMKLKARALVGPKGRLNE